MECPKSYLPDDLAVDFDRTKEKQGPFGNNDTSTPNYGKCPSDSLHWKEDDIKKLGACILESFNENVDA